MVPWVSIKALSYVAQDTSSENKGLFAERVFEKNNLVGYFWGNKKYSKEEVAS